MPNYTILLIDYEPRSLERSRRPLATVGYRVEIARDGLAAMEAFERIKPDLVLVEAMIPKKHGFEVCQDLKKTPQGKRTPILITTAVYKGRKYRSQALHLYGCDEYLEKPLPEEQLVTICARFLQDEDVAGRLARLQGIAEPPPAPSRTAAAAPSPRADAEQEILDRLDAILPGSAGGEEPEIEVILEEPNAAHREAPRAELAASPETEPEPPKQVISLDEARERKRHKKGRDGSGRSGRGRGRGGAAASPQPSPDAASQPMAMVVDQPMLETAPSPHAETRLLPDPIPLADAGAQSQLPGWVWVVAVAGLLGVFGLLWLMLSA